MADAAPTTFDYRDRTLDINGRRVFLREAVPNTPAAETLVLLHGWVGTSSWMFRHMMPELGGRYHTIAPDLPGFGRSRTMAELPSIDAYVDFLSRLVDAPGLHPPPPVCVFLGGGIRPAFFPPY